MQSKESCRARKERRTTERRWPRITELERTLEKYEGFIRWQAQEYAWRDYGDQKDFEQVGRQAVVQLFRSVEDRSEVRNRQGYYLKSIQNAMLDYYRREYRRISRYGNTTRRTGRPRSRGTVTEADARRAFSTTATNSSALSSNTVKPCVFGTIPRNEGKCSDFGASL